MTTATPDMLAAVVDACRAFRTREQIEAAGFTPGWHGEPVEVGQTAVVHGHGGWRPGIVTKVTPATVHVLFTTPGAIAEAQRSVTNALAVDPIRVRAVTYRLELKNWDFFAARVISASRYDQPHQLEAYQRYVDEGRESYAARVADAAADRARENARDAAERGFGPRVNITHGSGDRTGRKGTNLYVAQGA